LTTAECSKYFLVRMPLLESQHATVLSAEQETMLFTVGQQTCRTAFL
jgi:hypothetical protein